MSERPAIVSRQGLIAASFAQEIYWASDQLNALGAGHAISLVMHWRGPFEAKPFSAAMSLVIARHEVLRTTLSSVAGVICQSIAEPDASWAPTFFDCSSDADPEGEARQIVQRLAVEPFDLEHGPPIRVGVARVHPELHVSVIWFPRAVGDGASYVVVWKELLAAYRALREGNHPELPRLPIQYADYAAWERSRLRGAFLDAKRAYWKARLAGAPALALGTDRDGSSSRSPVAATCHVSLPASLAEGLEAVAKAEEVSSFCVYLGVYALLLARHSGQLDLVVGSASANRPRRELQNLIGRFAAPLPWRINVAQATTLGDLFRQVRDAAVSMAPFRDIPFAELAPMLPRFGRRGRHPFQAWFGYDASLEGVTLADGLVASESILDATVAEAEVALTVRAGKEGVTLAFTYDATLFEPSTIERMTAELVTLLHAAARNDAPIAALANDVVPRRIPPSERARVLGDPSAAPATPTQATLADIWRHVLEVGEIGIHDDFFALGGHSLHAMQIVGRVLERMNVVLSVSELFDGPTIATLADRIGSRTTGSPLPPITRVDRGGALPLSPAEERVWFLELLEPGTSTFNVPVVQRLHGKLDVVALEHAFGALIERHEPLRTRYTQDDRGLLWRKIDPSGALTIERHSVVDLPGPKRDSCARKLVDDAVSRPFDLRRGPLVRAVLIEIDANVVILVTVLHHLVSDGWSLDVLARDLTEFYAAARAGRPGRLPELAIQYADYAVWGRGPWHAERHTAQLAHWKARLQDLAPLQLPTDRPRPPTYSTKGAVHHFILEEPVVARLTALSKREGSTLFMTLLAAFETLLARYSGQNAFAVGTLFACRTEVDTEPLVGFFANTIALRADLEGDPTVRELFDRVRSSTLDAYSNQDLPIERLIQELSPSHRGVQGSPLFRVMLLLHVASAEMALDGMCAEPYPFTRDVSLFDIKAEFTKRGGRLHGELGYAAALFDAATVERFVEHFTVLLEALAEAPPDTRVGDLPIIAETERHRIREWNATRRELDDRRAIHELFEAEATRSPDAIALTDGYGTITYRELDERANDLAHELRAVGVGRESIVAMVMARSREMVIALYAVVKAGAAYCPLEPDLPAARLAFMVRDLQANVLLVTKEASPDFDVGDLRVVTVDARRPITNPRRPNVRFADTQLAYVIYTSGSTGTPKAAMNTHAGLRNRILWMQGQYPLDSSDTVLQKTPYAFDVSVWEFFWPLAFGAKLVVARPDGHREPRYLADLIASAGVTTLHFVPSMLQIFVEEPGVGDKTRTLRRCFASGEALPRALARRFHERIAGCELHNLYGPTEAAIDVTSWRCDLHGDGPVPIGAPIWNTQIHIVDARGAPCPPGVPGELLIGGVGVGRGYFRRADLTADKFIPDSFGAPGNRLYRTGNLARFLPDGAIEYCGRLDHQVKIRGLRVELGEIESEISKLPGVRECIVLAPTLADAVQHLVAYVSPVLATDEWRAALAKTLPHYMVPSFFVTLEAFPVTTNGKVDRRALPMPEVGQPRTGFVGPRNTTEEQLAAIWRDVFAVERVGVFDDFFELGGHSLLAVQIAARIFDATGVDIEVREIFDATTLAACAERIAREIADDS